MQTSYNWLNQFFNNELPECSELAKLLTKRIFEVDDISKVGSDTIMDIDVLPNRGADCLSIEGLSREISAILNRPMAKYSPLRPLSVSELKVPEVKVEPEAKCRRYMAVRVKCDDGMVKNSLQIITERLAVTGNRAINNVVDATNYVMMLTGQPLHAFDAQKIIGAIEVRGARPGETMVTLDEENIDLSPEMTVIADQVGPLALAGVKGGIRAAVGETTSEVIIESANFDPVVTRQTATKVGIRTEAVKRFENDLSASVTSWGLDWCLALLWWSCPGMIVSQVADHDLQSEEIKKILLPIKSVTERLGSQISIDQAASLLLRLGLKVEKTKPDHLEVEIPPWRKDLSRPIDLIEEVGRLYGYENIPEQIITPKKTTTSTDQRYQATQVLRMILVGHGFTEVYNRSFSSDGNLKVANPLVQDKPYLRTNLLDNLESGLDFNLRHTLFESDAVKLFEIGTVFTQGHEEMKAAFGVAYRKKRFGTGQDKVKEVMEDINQSFDVGGALDYNTRIKDSCFIIELSLRSLLEHASEVPKADLTSFLATDTIFDPISPYPRIIRDISLLVDSEQEPSEVSDLIRSKAGPWLIQDPVLFDRFVKNSQLSLAFRLVFQAKDRTLSDEEVNEYMEEIARAVKEKGWTVR